MPILIKQHDIVLLINNVFMGDNYELLRHSQGTCIPGFSISTFMAEMEKGVG